MTTLLRQALSAHELAEARAIVRRWLDVAKSGEKDADALKGIAMIVDRMDGPVVKRQEISVEATQKLVTLADDPDDEDEDE